MDGPIFLAGAAGSGKTLLRLALSTHPRLAISRRTYMWTRFYDRFGDLRRPDNLERCLAAMLRHKHTRALHPDPDRIRREFRQGEPTYARLFALFHQHYAERLGRARWGDQLGFVERYAETIFAAYPDARMIQMVRDPRDRYGAAASRGRRQVGAVGAATAHWLHSSRLALYNQRRFPDRYMVVRCEDLVARFEQTLREVCAFIGEDFVPATLTLEGAQRFGEDHDEDAPGESAVSSATRSLQAVAGATLSRREVAFIQTQASRDMEVFGYKQQPTRLSLRERLLFWLLDWPVNRAGMVAWRLLQSRQPA